MDTEIDPLELARQAFGMGEDDESSVGDDSSAIVGSEDQQERMREVHHIAISTADLLLLDKVAHSASIQSKIDSIRERIALEDAAYARHLPLQLRRCLADIIERAEAESHVYCDTEHSLHGSQGCEGCGVSPGFDPYLRNGTYAVKGQPNHDKPRRQKGAWICEQVLCLSCFELVKKPLLKALRGKLLQIDRDLTGKEPTYELRNYYLCTKCNWEGLLSQEQEEQLHHERSCPSCKASPQNTNRTHRLELQWGHSALVRVSDGKIMKDIGEDENY